ncbi:MAG: DUF3696 domain-containing protein [Bryobacteraceae bacterium]
MITNLRAQNFKSWKDTGDLRLAPLTGLFGTNSSGKSSILQLLLMLKQTAESSDPNRVLHLGGDPKSYVDLGTFADVIHGHDLGSSLLLSITWPISGRPFHFDVSLREENQRIAISEFAYSGDGRSHRMSVRSDGQYDFVIDGERAFSAPPPQPFRLPLVVKPRGEKAPVHNLLEVELQDLSYLGPLRVPPRRSYLFRGTRPRDVGKDGEETIQALLAVQQSAPSVEKNVAEWLVKMKLIHSFKLRPIAPNRRDHEVLIKTTEESPEVLLTDVGFGVSQLLPVLVLCYYVPEGTTLLLEQPELHLHPSAQSVLADVFIDVVKNRKLQIIFESHSEHLLRRIQRRIAEETFPAQDASMYFCHIENGESHATALELTDEGFIKNWPKDFFGDEMGEVAALAKESISRRRQAR